MAAPLEWTGTPWDWAKINLSALKQSCQVLHQSSTKVTNRGAEREDWQVSWHRELGQHPGGHAEYAAVQSWAWTLHLEGTILAELLLCNAEKHHLNTTLHSFPHRKGPIQWVSWSLNKRLCPQSLLLTKCLLCWSSASGDSRFHHYGRCPFTYSPEISWGLYHTPESTCVSMQVSKKGEAKANLWSVFCFSLQRWFSKGRFFNHQQQNHADTLEMQISGLIQKWQNQKHWARRLSSFCCNKPYRVSLLHTRLRISALRVDRW